MLKCESRTSLHAVYNISDSQALFYMQYNLSDSQALF